MSVFGAFARVLVAGILYLPLRWLAFDADQWWIAALVALALAFAIFFLGGKLFMRLLLTPFMMKSDVMKGCVVEVHSLARAGVPEPRRRGAHGGDACCDEEGDHDEHGDHDPGEDDEDDEDERKELAAKTWYALEATFKPAERGGKGFRHWEPGEMQVVRPDADVRPSSRSSDEDDVGTIHRIHYLEEGEWKEDEGMKLGGPVRLRLELGVNPGTTKVALRYYFNKLAILDLPK